MRTGRLAIKAKVSMVFYEGQTFDSLWDKLCGKVLRWCIAKEVIEHVCLSVGIEGCEPRLYYVTKRGRSRWTRARALHKTWKPCAIIHLDTLSIDTSALNGIKPIKFSPFRVMLYLKLTKHFLKWKPKAVCTMKVIEIARSIGFDINDHVMPMDLYKELKENANDNDCWQSTGWQNNFG